MIPPGSWLGLLGGGQLGRMFTHAAQSMGYKVLVLDPERPLARGDVHRRADFVPAPTHDDVVSVQRTGVGEGND